MPDPAILARNLSALARADPALADRLHREKPASRLQAVTSRSGLPVPCLLAGQRRIALHSTVDPLHEAERAAASVAGGYVVCLGLGGGYALSCLLRRPETERLLVVESGADMLRGFLEVVDLSTPLADPRVRLVLPERAEAIGPTLLEDFLPAVYRSFCTFPLRARVDADPGFYGAVSRAIDRALLAASRDYTVQSRFGLRWLRNTLANLRAIQERGDVPQARPWPVMPARRVLVTGAGPSLEGQMSRIELLRPGSFLLATDASVGPLAWAGITPDAILSVDCQHVSYHHFLGGIPSLSILLLDIASPPLLARLAPRALFLSTAHPLAAYVVRRGLDLPYVEVTGGNVTHAAVSLAERLGAEEIHLFGVDLSYPAGKPYARGCFLYSALAASASRLSPLEASVAGVGIGSPSSERVSAPGGFAYVTQPMAAYRANLRDLAARIHARLIPEPGMGPPLALPLPRPAREQPAPAPPAQGRAISAILRAYGDDLGALPRPTASFPVYLAELRPEQRELLATLLPVMASRRAALGSPSFPEVLVEAKAAVLRALRPERER